MPIGQDEDIRIYELPEAQELTAGMKVAVDSETDGTKSFDLTTAMSEKVEEFVAEYNVTYYEDIDAAYKAGKSVICKYRPSPQGNPEQVYYLRSMQYIPFAGYMFGTVTSILGFEFIVCRKNNDTTVWSVSQDNALKTPESGQANGKILSTDGTTTLWIEPPEGVPSSTSQDEGKVLTVDSNGAAAWAQAASGSTTMAVDIPSTLTTDQEIVEFINTTVTAFNADSTKKSLIVYPPDSNVPYVYLRSDIVDPFYAHHFAADLSTVKYRENVTIHSWDYGNAPYSSPGQRLVKMYYKTTPESNPKYKIQEFYSEPTEYKSYYIQGDTMAEKHAAIVAAFDDFNNNQVYWNLYKGIYLEISGVGSGPVISRSYEEGYYDIITLGNANFCSSTDYQRENEQYPVFNSFTTFYAESLSGTPTYRFTKQVASCGLGYMTFPVGYSSSCTVANNQISELTPSVSTFTVKTKLAAYSNEAVNICLEITPTVNCTLIIKSVKYNGTQNVETTLKHSVAAGNVLEANKTYQVTAVGNCWTMAEFEA